MSGNSKKKIAFNYLGGKITYLDFILPLFPEHTHFIDLFCGPLSVTLNKTPSPIETANDIYSEIINFFSVLRDSPDELLRKIELTPYSREEYYLSYEMSKSSDSIEMARRFFIRARQSFAGLGVQQPTKGWQYAKLSSCSKISEKVSAWLGGIEKLKEIIERLRIIQFENDSFEKVIDRFDSEISFFYCDPPYPRESRSGNYDYKYDFPDEKHELLASKLNSINGLAMVSGYDCDLMNDLYKGWYVKRAEVKMNNMRNTAVQEVVWMNYDPDKLHGQQIINFN